MARSRDGGSCRPDRVARAVSGRLAGKDARQFAGQQRAERIAGVPDSGQAASQFVLRASAEITRASGDRPQHVGQIVEAIHQQMADAMLALQDAVGDDGGRSSGDGAEAFPSVEVDDEVRGAGLIFDAS